MKTKLIEWLVRMNILSLKGIDMDSYMPEEWTVKHFYRK
jgi:hypothetical protein